MYLGDFLLKLKQGRNLVWSLLKKNKVLIILVVAVLQGKPNFYFDGLPWILLQFCVTLVLLQLNGKLLMKWLSEQFWRCCSYIYDLI